MRPRSTCRCHAIPFDRGPIMDLANVSVLDMHAFTTGPQLAAVAKAAMTAAEERNAAAIIVLTSHGVLVSTYSLALTFIAEL